MAKTAEDKFALCTKEIQRFKEQAIEVLDDLQLWDELRKEIEGMKDTAIDVLTKIKRLMAKVQESRESLKTEDYSKSGVTGFSSLRLPGLELPTFDGDLATWLTFREVFTATISTQIKTCLKHPNLVI
ncbi:hypothetical protein AVEN_48590-1 [Araneus ventricosus]|uniref:Uncharacterized protein n=1 Tax=Araneus ventricosus TaxID=182803 RepID=A0A4Y2I237_ARAVE|nr:hypothetical protein AVEN_48590-1 [Araneus ventricosus]